MALHPLIIQMICYAVVIVLSVFILAFLFRGLFWKFIKVKTSLGRLVLVKIRAVNRDFFITGKIEDNNLVYKLNKEERRLTIPDNSYFYSCLGVKFIDVDEQKNSVAKPDFNAVTGFDAVKYNDLYLRALYKPQITTNQEKIILVLLIIAVLMIAIELYMLYKGMKMDSTILQELSSLKSLTTHASITPAGV